MTSKKQGKGTADLMMPFGDWFPTPLFGAVVRVVVGVGLTVAKEEFVANSGLRPNLSAIYRIKNIFYKSI